MTTRRGFLLGLGAVIAAPAVIRTPGILMPIKSIDLFEPNPSINWRLHKLHLDQYYQRLQAEGAIYDYKVVCDQPNDGSDSGISVFVKPVRSIKVEETRFVLAKAGQVGEINRWIAAVSSPA